MEFLKETKSEIELMEEDIREVSSQLEKAKSMQNGGLVFELSKEFHIKKLKLLETIESNNHINSTITARELKRIVESRPKLPRYETGIYDLDKELNGGFEIGTFVQIAGESFVGKTTIVMKILSNIARYKEVLFFSFEMGESRTHDRFTKLFTTEKQWDNMLVNEKARKLDEIVKEIKKRASSGVKFIAIDSKMKIETDDDNDYARFQRISRELSKVAQLEEVIILMINQMNEEDSKTNRLSFKGGNDQMYDADIALFYQFVKDENVNPEFWKRKLVCRKNRQDERLFSIDDFKLDENKFTHPKEIEYQSEKIEMPFTA